jgi:hypothetical protein
MKNAMVIKNNPSIKKGKNIRELKIKILLEII